MGGKSFVKTLARGGGGYIYSKTAKKKGGKKIINAKDHGQKKNSTWGFGRKNGKKVTSKGGQGARIKKKKKKRKKNAQSKMF